MDLSLSVGSFASVPGTTEFPSVRRLSIESTPGWAAYGQGVQISDLSPLPDMFPALIELSVKGLHTEADLTPLRALTALRKLAVEIPKLLLKGSDHLPPQVELVISEPAGWFTELF